MSRTRARARTALLLAAVAAAPSCARVLSQYDVAPSGLARPEQSLRAQLAAGHADTAWTALASAIAGTHDGYAPEDALLRSLYAGVLAHYAGQWQESALALDRAVQLADDRVASISRSALSVISSDGALEYVPTRSERLLIHYYAALDFMRAGQPQSAAVEARRLSQLLARHDTEAAADNVELRAFLRYFAGAVFEAAGERSDAEVAYRNAHALSGAFPEPVAMPQADSGTVVVLIERGFVAHKVEEALVVALAAGEVRALTGGRRERDHDREDVAGMIAARVLQQLTNPAPAAAPTRRPRTHFVSLPPRAPRNATRRVCDTNGSTAHSATAPDVVSDADAAVECTAARHDDDDDDDDDDDNPYLLKMAWPAFSQERVAGYGAVVRVDTMRVQAGFGADVSRSVMSDFQSQRAALVARTVLRSATKLALTRKVEQSAGRNQETVGRVLGALTNLGGVLTERADTRSWHLLPHSLELVRLRVPAGAQTVVVECTDAAGTRRQLELPVTVRPGSLAFASTRIWR